jgi:hypothetical protein
MTRYALAMLAGTSAYATPYIDVRSYAGGN